MVLCWMHTNEKFNKKKDYNNGLGLGFMGDSVIFSSHHIEPSFHVWKKGKKAQTNSAIVLNVAFHWKLEISCKLRSKSANKKWTCSPARLRVSKRSAIVWVHCNQFLLEKSWSVRNNRLWPIKTQVLSDYLPLPGGGRIGGLPKKIATFKCWITRDHLFKGYSTLSNE